jgi:hypothetical protein
MLRISDLGMSVADKVSYFSRFTVKFVEMVAAGIATAVSGYLVAHLGGYLFASAPTPAAIQVAPSAGGTINSPATPSARAKVNAKEAMPSRKHPTIDSSVADSKPRDAKEAKEEESVEAQVRAALAKVGADQPATPDMAPHQADIAPALPAAATPRPIEESAGGAATVAPLPREADIAPPGPQAPLQPDPLAAVEIKSRPVAGVEASPSAQPPPPPANAQENAQEDKGLLSAIAHIPDLLRSAPTAPASDPPRPPLPVGN